MPKNEVKNSKSSHGKAGRQKQRELLPEVKRRKAVKRGCFLKGQSDPDFGRADSDSQCW